MTELSIVILHHGSPEEVSENLQALCNAILPQKTEVFVINNGARGLNEKIIVPDKINFELKFFDIGNHGYAQGNNYGLSMARGRYLCILNPDVIVKKNTFQKLIEYIESRPFVGIVAPRLVYPNGKIQDNYRVFPRFMDLIIKRTFLRKIFLKRMRRYLMWDKDPNESEAVDWLTGAFQLFTRKAWEKIGPKDERFFLFMSDVDICRKAWNQGFDVHYVGNAEALHNDERLSSGGILDFFRKKTMRIHFKDAVKYYLKYLRKNLPAKAPSRFY